MGYPHTSQGDLMQITPFAPLTLAKLFGVKQDDVAYRLRVSTDYLRRLARDPQQATRVRLAELEASLEHERVKARTTLGETAGAAERCQAAAHHGPGDGSDARQD